MDAFNTVHTGFVTMASSLASSVDSDDAVAAHHNDTVRAQEEALLSEAVISFYNAYQGTKDAHEAFKAADEAGGN